MKHIIDLETFERKQSVEFFKNFQIPTISITSEVKCTGAKERAKQLGISFFLYYSHAIIKAVNEIKEFKYRISDSWEISWYDTIHILAVIQTGENGDYNTLKFPYHDDRKTFATYAQHLIDGHEVVDNPFSDELDTQDKEELDVFLISAVPTLSFTGITFAHRRSYEIYPVSLIGKVIVRDGNEYMPIAVNVNHAFVDGHHLSLFYNRISELLKI